MENHIYLDNNIDNIIYQKIQEKINIHDLNETSLNKERNNKFIEIINVLKVVYNKLSNNSFSIILSYSEEKIYEIIFVKFINLYKKILKKKPHIIVSFDNKILLNILKTLYEKNIVSLTIITPNVYGIILLNDITKNIKKSTCLISIPYSNHINGSINDIQNITKFCNSNNIFLHIDISNIFLEMNLNIKNIDLITISYKKFNIKSISIILSNKIVKILNEDKFIEEFSKLENKYSISNYKNVLYLNCLLSYKLKQLTSIENKNYNNKKLFINKLKEYIPIISYEEYINNTKNNNDISIVYFDYLKNQPNILVLSIYCKNIKFSNKIFKKYINQFGIHILPLYNNNDIQFLKNDNNLLNGLIYLNFNESIKNTDIQLLVKGFLKCIQMQYKNLFNEILDNTNKTKLTIKSINKVKKRVRFNNPEYMILSKKKGLPNYKKNIKSILVKN